MQDVDQAAGHDDLDRLADVGGADVVRESRQRDLAVLVHPPRHSRGPLHRGSGCRCRRGYRCCGGLVWSDGPVGEPEPLDGPAAAARLGEQSVLWVLPHMVLPMSASPVMASATGAHMQLTKAQISAISASSHFQPPSRTQHTQAGMTTPVIAG